MERLLQGPIDSCFMDELLAAEFLEHGILSRSSLRFEEAEESQISTEDLNDKVSFLQMLQNAEPPPLSNHKDPSFMSFMNTQFQTLEPQSCVTHEFTDPNTNPAITCTEAAQKQDLKHARLLKPSNGISKEKRRKRTKSPKNQEEVESQRMTHIAVERNRRRQMNDHLNSLKSLMPSTYIQRGDQASIIGGAIDFIKELEQLLQSLVAENSKKTGKSEEEIGKEVIATCPYDSSSSSSSLSGILAAQLGVKSDEERIRVEKSNEETEIEVVVIQNHVNLKVRCKKRQQGQLLRAIVSLEQLRLHVLHLNVTSSNTSIFYSFNLKIEDDCKLVSGDEIASAVHQIFTCINGG